MLDVKQSALLVIDVQEKLFKVMHWREQLLENLTKLIRGIAVLELPVPISEQYPQGLGATLPEMSELLPDAAPLSKLHFSCCQDKTINKSIRTLGRKQIIVCGIEAHVCVYQTVADLLNDGYEVYVAADGVASRQPEDMEIGLNLMRDLGAAITGTETVLFELLKIASGDQFKAISKIVK